MIDTSSNKCNVVSVKLKQPDPRTVALNLIAEHGKPAFHKLIEMFNDNVSGTKIGKIFGVTRQRVSQWKQALGYTHTTFEVKSEISDLTPSTQATSKNSSTLV